MVFLIALLAFSYFFLKMLWRANKVRTQWKAHEAVAIVEEVFAHGEITAEEREKLLRIIGKKPGWRRVVSKSLPA